MVVEIGGTDFQSGDFEHKRLLEVAGCEGCMRACWIDTSSMFRTVKGFFETARLTVQRRDRQPVSYNEARGWARHEDVEIVPLAASAK